MSTQWRNAVVGGLLMFVLYVGVDIIAIKLGWLTHIGWTGGTMAALVIAWLYYRRSARQGVDDGDVTQRFMMDRL